MSLSTKMAPTPPRLAPLVRVHSECVVPGCSGGDVFRPSLAGNGGYSVALVGEAPEVGKSTFKLTRLIEWAGLEREKFDIYPVVWCRPLNNQLEGTPYEQAAVEWWKPYWRPLLSRSHVVVPMGNVALSAFTGRKGILKERGYLGEASQERLGLSTRILPTVHPSFIQRGQSKYSAAFIHDIQKAVKVAREGMVFEQTNYVLDPSPGAAYQWAQDYRARLESSQSPIRLAYDIETPGKDADESESDTDDPTYFIWRIGFAYEGLSALSIPWTPEYIPAIKLILDSPGDKVVWNAGFDNPRIKHNGVTINGLIHDGMVAWHILHSDLPKGLGFVATFTCPYQPAWKHLSTKQPAFYNATDADVELRSFQLIEQELKSTGLWGVYQRDVIDLDPILMYMSSMGMPIDPVVREDRAHKLATRQATCLAEMSAAVPIAARRIDHEFVKTPADTSGLIPVERGALVKRCSQCGVENPRKPHFKTLKRPTVKKPQNPCSGATVTEASEDVVRYARLADFTPSRHQLIAYQNHMNRAVPTVWDKKEGKRKPSMGEKALKTLIGKFPLDKLYPLVLQFRELDKIGGTYIGRWVDAI